MSLPHTSSPVPADVTAIIINFNTLRLAKQAYESLLRIYPGLPIVLVDNNSDDTETTQWVHSIDGICNTENIGHGPAMHQAIIERVKTPYVLTFDSDCIANKGGFLEGMLTFFANPAAYAIGWMRWVAKWSGVPLEGDLTNPSTERFVKYIHPAVGLYSVEKYKTMRPFAQLGAPCLLNMLDADMAGYIVSDYPVFEYITHLIAGTRRMYGGRWNPQPTEKPGEWLEKTYYPI